MNGLALVPWCFSLDDMVPFCVYYQAPESHRRADLYICTNTTGTWRANIITGKLGVVRDWDGTVTQAKLHCDVDTQKKRSKWRFV